MVTNTRESAPDLHVQNTILSMVIGNSGGEKK